jgi:hypothetical protein
MGEKHQPARTVRHGKITGDDGIPHVHRHAAPLRHPSTMHRSGPSGEGLIRHATRPVARAGGRAANGVTNHAKPAEVRAPAASASA